MSELSNHQCIATPKDSPKLTDAEIAQLQPQIPDWVVETNNGILRLENIFSFGNFIEAMAFANKIADIAEANDHHPALLVQYGSVKVSWWSHSIGGLHLNDFVLAAKTDKAYTNK
jgi:4a-hydroxytetrahydrobiopterin dehydratase